MISSLPPTPVSCAHDERSAVQLLARNAILHDRLRFVRGAQLEQTRSEIARLRAVGIAMENAARVRCGMRAMDAEPSTKGAP